MLDAQRGGRQPRCIGSLLRAVLGASVALVLRPVVRLGGSGVVRLGRYDEALRSAPQWMHTSVADNGELAPSQRAGCSNGLAARASERRRGKR